MFYRYHTTPSDIHEGRMVSDISGGCSQKTLTCSDKLYLQLE